MANDNPSVEPVQEKGQDLALYVSDLFTEFKNGRKEYETKAEEWWYNFLSQYQSNKNWRTKEGEGNRSRLFIKLTQQKCYTAHAKVMDALGSDVPFEMEALENLDYNQIPREALEAAAQFRKSYIADYLKYIKFFDTIDDATLDATIFPAAIIKGPIMVVDRQPVVKRRMIGGIPAEQLDPRIPPYMVVIEPVEKYVFETVPFWDYYVDVNSKNTKKSIGEIHYKRLLPQEFRDLANDPGYDAEQMKLAIEAIDSLKSSMPEGDNDNTHKQLGDKFNGFEAIKDNKIGVCEFHGLASAKSLRDFGADVPENIGDDEDVEACIVTCTAGHEFVLKAQYNFYGYRPFMVFGVKKIPNSVYKNSIAGLIDDSQSMVNSAIRMYIDNKALSGNGCLAIHDDKINWQKTGNAQIYPRKTFYLKGNVNVKDAIQTLTFSDTTMGTREMIEFFLRISDEESGIPKYSQGDVGQNFLNKTAAGMSMLMGAANVNLKPFLKNIDDSVIEPVVERLDALFSMLGKYPPQMDLPLKITATGTISMMARELIVENMMKFLAITQNPEDGLVVRRREIIKQIGEKLGLSKFVKTEQEIQKIEQELAARQQAQPMKLEPSVDADKIFDKLLPTEQAQILQSIGVQPDPRRLGGLTPQATGQPMPMGPGMHQMEDGGIMLNEQMPPEQEQTI
jgi:hypothetical protein